MTSLKPKLLFITALPGLLWVPLQGLCVHAERPPSEFFQLEILMSRSRENFLYNKIHALIFLNALLLTPSTTLPLLAQIIQSELLSWAAILQRWLSIHKESWQSCQAWDVSTWCRAVKIQRVWTALQCKISAVFPIFPRSISIISGRGGKLEFYFPRTCSFEPQSLSTI